MHPNKAYLNSLISQAQNLRLAETAQWQYLLHYQTGILGKTESETDDATFFTARNGKYDPQAELAATLTRFFSNQPWGKKAEPAQCAFVARYEWLNSQLNFDAKKLKPQPCPKFDAWYNGINPGNLTLIFPSAYLNNPSSMFGHTLLRVDTPGQNENTRLLSYAINYGANTGTDNGVAFAFKGIFGGYFGTIGIGPYYKKVKEYSDFESRDIWEYQLAFSSTEIRRMMAHVWELRGITFDYYFFDENCSYMVLTLLDVARPSLGFSQQLQGWVVPSDTLRLIAAQPGLIKKTIYRPAAGTKLTHFANSLPDADQRAALALANHDTTLPVFLERHTAARALSTTQPHGTEKNPEKPRLDEQQQQADILLLAHDFVRYEFLAQRGEKSTSSRLARSLLRARSTISTAQAPSPVPTPAIPPEQGHATGIVQTGIKSENGDEYIQLRLRPAYHDLLDNDDGYVPGAQINFLNIALRYRTTDQKLEIDDLTLLDIVSLSPRTRFFKPISWRMRAAWQRRILPDVQSSYPLAFQGEAGGGLAFQPHKNILAFGLVNLGVSFHSQFKQHYTAGIGAEIGVIVQATTQWKLQLYVQNMNFRTGKPHTYNTYKINQRFIIKPQHAINLDWAQQQAYGRRLESWVVSWRWYM
ncbi:MAG: DUF4105 domain-containing protein [Ectothiorhodospiraceae bacterium]|nr:DUF4105 domain-containing protein [Ectothiorhodospiraceae bacterium]